MFTIFIIKISDHKLVKTFLSPVKKLKRFLSRGCRHIYSVYLFTFGHENLNDYFLVLLHFYTLNIFIIKKYVILLFRQQKY